MSDGLTRAGQVLILTGQAFVLRVVVDSLVRFKGDFLLRLLYGLSVFFFGRDGPQWDLVQLLCLLNTLLVFLTRLRVAISDRRSEFRPPVGIQARRLRLKRLRDRLTCAVTRLSLYSTD